jgi:DNA polymerase-3 subunit beta
MIKVKASDLKRAALLARTITESKSTIPILQCVMLKAVNNVLRVNATDLDATAVIQSPCIGNGEWCLAFDKLAIIINAAKPDDEISISGDQFASVSTGKTKARIAVAPSDDWPSIGQGVSGDEVFTMPAKSFLDGYQRCAAARMTEGNGNMSLSGIHMVSHKSTLTMEGCNSHMVHRLVFDEVAVSHPVDVILPGDMLASLSALADGETDIHISKNEGTITICAGSKSLTTKLIDGEYPDINRVIPKIDREKEIGVDVKSLNDALKATATLNRNDGSAVLLASSDGELTLTAFGLPGEEVNIPVECDGNGELEAWLNPDYLRAVMDCCNSSTILIRQNTDRIMSGNGVNGFTAVVSTMRQRPRADMQEAA